LFLFIQFSRFIIIIIIIIIIIELSYHSWCQKARSHSAEVCWFLL